VILALTIPLLYGFYQAAQGLAPLLNGAFRISSTFFGSPVGYALFLAGMGLLLVSKKKISILTLTYLGAVAVMILSTHSRQATLAFLIGLFILSLLQRRMRLILLAIIVISPVLIFSSTLISQFLYRLQLFTTINADVINQVMSNPKDSLWVLAGVDNSALLRVHTFVVGWDLFKVSPLFGRGLGSFVMNYEQITGLSNLPAHNDYLMYLVETGLIGFIIFLGIQFLVLHSLLKRRAQIFVDTMFFAYSVAVAYFAINVLSFLSNPYYFYEIQFWIWLGIGIAIGLIQKDIANHHIHNGV
jgi:O-antigen ligase